MVSSGHKSAAQSADGVVGAHASHVKMHHIARGGIAEVDTAPGETGMIPQGNHQIPVKVKETFGRITVDKVSFPVQTIKITPNGISPTAGGLGHCFTTADESSGQ